MFLLNDDRIMEIIYSFTHTAVFDIICCCFSFFFFSLFHWIETRKAAEPSMPRRKKNWKESLNISQVSRFESICMLFIYYHFFICREYIIWKTWYLLPPTDSPYPSSSVHTNEMSILSLYRDHQIFKKFYLHIFCICDGIYATMRSSRCK